MKNLKYVGINLAKFCASSLDRKLKNIIKT